jgi:hypothetical protein
MKSHAQKPGQFSVVVQVFYCAFFLPLILASCSAVSAQMKPGDVRKAYGEQRASIMESLLQTLYPGAVVQWDPYFTVQLPGENLRQVALPVYVWASPTGGLQGVATIEFDGQKDRFIFGAQNFRRSEAPNLPTDLIVFRSDAAGHIQTYKKLPLDPDEPLTELKIVTLKDWSHTEWPTLEIQYQTHRPSSSSFTTIEWRALFDANSGHFISRLPLGISRKIRGGGEQFFMLGLGRISPSTIEIADRLSRQTRQYECSDPCVMEAETLLAKWNLEAPTASASAKSSVPSTPAPSTRDANSAASGGSQPPVSSNSEPATIRLKNGRTIHADSATEDSDKIEYAVGESTFKIPKAVVAEITRSVALPAVEAAPPTYVSTPASQASSGPLNPTGRQTSSADCPRQNDPYVPCRTVFFVQTLMGLGETQRFRLIDDGNHDLTAQANWAISDVADQVEFSVVNGVPRVYSKAYGMGIYGMVQLYATVGDNTAIARIYIQKPEDIASNTMGRRGAPTFMGTSRLLQLIPDAPFFGRVQ